LVGKSLYEHFSPVVPKKFRNDVNTWARSCLHCQQSKAHRHTRLLPQHIAIPQRWFGHLHIDLVEPLHYSNNSNDVFTVIDRTSKWMEAVPLSDISAATWARALIFSWISSFGVPETFTFYLCILMYLIDLDNG
jgi:cleavage and polyadenylation specificity factor subunit 1